MMFLLRKNRNKQIVETVIRMKSEMIRSIGLDCKQLVFGQNQSMIQLSEHRQKQLINTDVKFITTMMRDSNEQLIEQGTYCEVLKIRELKQQILLRGLYQVDILDIQEMEMDQSQKELLNEELIIDDYVRNEQSVSQLDIVQNQESKLYELQVKRIDGYNLNYDFEMEMKMKYLLDGYQKIVFSQYGDYPMVNYNLKDVQQIVDIVGNHLWHSDYFQKDQILEIYRESDVSKKVEMLIDSVKQYQQFQQNFNQLGQIAQNNMKQRKMQELYQEMKRVAKQLLDRGQKKKSQIEKIKEKFYNSIDKKIEQQQEVVEIFEQELKKYEQLDPMSSEANIIKQYLETVSSIPFNRYSQKEIGLDQVKQILDQEHFGIEKVKERIMELIAVYKLKKSLKGKVIMLVGPPGVGKTSLGHSIAQGLGKKYGRISMGGESDVAFLKGHRKTYIGAYPGKMIQQIREMDAIDGVILLDEMDKVGLNQISGDIQASLLEILDKEQNNSFVDNYLDFKVDLSNIVFICTANSLQNIQQPLLDRMDIIELNSYTHIEKKQIFEKHLYKKILNEVGLQERQIEITDIAVNKIIEDYCREPGVRSLEKQVRKIIEKVAYKIVTQNIEMLKVDLDNLNELIGQPTFKQSSLYEQVPVGVSCGLAYTQYGGSLVYIECSRSNGQKMQVTGQLGKVMKESSQIALNYAKHFLYSLDNQFFDDEGVHIHVPEGATPKDGPSAGITIVTSLISLATSRPIDNRVAMTGEISLNGNVLPIGGVKEKVLAAQREGLSQLIFPIDNQSDIELLDSSLKADIDFHFVSHYQEVYDIAFQ